MTATAPIPPMLSADEARARYGLSAAAGRLTADGPELVIFFKRLLEHRLYPDAIKYSAHALSKREAVWWGCLCLWLVLRADPDPAEAAAVQAALTWVEEPSEAHRRAAEAAATAAGLDTPCGMLASAAFLATGSVSPAGQPPVGAKPDLTPNLIATAVMMAAADDAEATDGRLRQFLKLAVEVAEKRTRWEARLPQGERPLRPPTAGPKEDA